LKYKNDGEWCTYIMQKHNQLNNTVIDRIKHKLNNSIATFMWAN